MIERIEFPDILAVFQRESRDDKVKHVETVE